MPETLNPARRWNSFVCPGCRFVFRVSQDHDGKGVVCPACRIMLRLPGPDEETPPLLTPPSDGDSELQEEIEAGGDEDYAGSSGGSDLKFLLSLAVPALALLGLFAWWMAPDPAPIAAPRPIPVDLGTNAVETKAEPVAKSLVIEIESLVKAFLEAPTPDEALKYVRDPEKTAPKLKSWFAGKPYVAPGFREIIGDSVTSSEAEGEIFTVNVRAGDFEAREIVILGTEGNLKVDWESWVGWSEMPWDEFLAKRPVEGKWFRVVLSRVQYYNFDFKDESEWVSYRLASPDGSAALFGYVPRISPLDEKIRPVDETATAKLLLKLKFPPGAVSNNQVIIDGVSGQDWVVLSAPENP